MDQLDIRFPLGLLFLILGLVLIGYGLVSAPEIYATHSLAQNVNLVWGTVFTLFGGFILWLAKRGAKHR